MLSGLGFPRWHILVHFLKANTNLVFKVRFSLDFGSAPKSNVSKFTLARIPKVQFGLSLRARFILDFGSTTQQALPKLSL